MKVKIEKKVKIELNISETNELIDILRNIILKPNTSIDYAFAKQLKQELER